MQPDDLGRYERSLADVVDEVPAAEHQHLAEQRARREAGQPNHYGHDLIGAVKRGWRKRARATCREAGDMLVKAGWKDAPRPRFVALLYCLIENAGEEGITEEEVRRSLQRFLDANDATSIAKLITRHEEED